MLERLTDGALEAVVAAREAARGCRHRRADAPHLLLGILSSPSATGCLMLNRAGLRYDDVRRVVEDMYEQETDERSGPVALTPQAKKLLDLALHEARAEEQPLVATAHLALACSRATAPASIKPFVEGREEQINDWLKALRRTGCRAGTSDRRADRDSALRRANEVRIQRAKVKRDLKTGRARFDVLLLDPPACVQTAQVFDMLLAVPRYGRVKATKILQLSRISPSKTIGGLSERQRKELVMLVRP